MIEEEGQGANDGCNKLTSATIKAEKISLKNIFLSLPKLKAALFLWKVKTASTVNKREEKGKEDALDTPPLSVDPVVLATPAVVAAPVVEVAGM